ncbi:hypothetical protein SDC9_198301 [bioreactor metagenome]|uniref:Uncharacterized protein n=1 Tax=bioreactor metagenome TaxID=1076179 RepID=A0A645IJL6_9ZZZZ
MQKPLRFFRAGLPYGWLFLSRCLIAWCGFSPVFGIFLSRFDVFIILSELFCFFKQKSTESAPSALFFPNNGTRCIYKGSNRAQCNRFRLHTISHKICLVFLWRLLHITHRAFFSLALHSCCRHLTYSTVRFYGVCNYVAISGVRALTGRNPERMIYAY